MIARPFNTYGPRQSLRAVIPTVVAQALAGGELDARRADADARLRLRRATPSTALIAPGRHDGRRGRDVQRRHRRRRVRRRRRDRRRRAARARAASCAAAEERMRPPSSEVHQLLGDAARLRAATGWAPQTDAARRPRRRDRVDAPTGASRAQRRLRDLRRRARRDHGRRPRQPPGPVHDGAAQAADAARRPADPRRRCCASSCARASTAISISVGHLSGLIEGWVRHQADYGVPVDFVYEDEPLGTAGALAQRRAPRRHVPRAQRRRPHDAGLRRRSSRTTAPAGAIATMARQGAHRRRPVRRRARRRRRAGRAPRGEAAAALHGRAWASTRWSPQIIDLIAPGERIDFPDLLLRAIERRPRRADLRYEGYWRDIGNRDDYEAAIDDFEADPGRFLGG